MFMNSIAPLFARDLHRLKSEIEAFPDLASLWRVNGTITNNAGNLCLHMCGNLQHFIGATLGKSDYVRDRTAEFGKRDVPVTELIAEIDRTIEVVRSVLAKLNDADVAGPFPIKMFDKEMSTVEFMMHLEGHLNYHLGQINYLRRMA